MPLDTMARLVREAPLHSFGDGFLLGMLVARRRQRRPKAICNEA
jgi:hypothetical protein